MKLYKSTIEPMFIETISEGINKKYDGIIKELQKPYKKDPEKTMNDLIFQNECIRMQINGNFINKKADFSAHHFSI